MNPSQTKPGEAEESEDVALMGKVKAGDMGAFEQLVERHQHRVVGTVAHMLGGGAEAEDIAQQVFVRVWKSAGRYEPRAKFTTWLMTITRNLVFNEMRRRQRVRWVPLDPADDEEPHLQLADPDAATPDGALVKAELAQAVESAIASLPEKHRLAIVLRRYENMSYEDIAAVLKTSVSAVKSLLFRARADLKEKLAKHLED